MKEFQKSSALSMKVSCNTKGWKAPTSTVQALSSVQDDQKDITIESKSGPCRKQFPSLVLS